MHKSIHIEQQVGTDQQFNLQTKKIYPYRSCTRIYRLHNSIWVYIRVLSFETLNYLQLLMSVHFFFCSVCIQLWLIRTYPSTLPTLLLWHHSNPPPKSPPPHPYHIWWWSLHFTKLHGAYLSKKSQYDACTRVTTNLLCILNSMYTYTILTQDAVML